MLTKSSAIRFYIFFDKYKSNWWIIIVKIIVPKNIYELDGMYPKWISLYAICCAIKEQNIKFEVLSNSFFSKYKKITTKKNNETNKNILEPE